MTTKARQELIKYKQECLATCEPEKQEHFEIEIALLQTDISGQSFNAFMRAVQNADDIRLKHVLDSWQNFRAFAARLGKDELDILLLSQRNFGVKSLDELKKAVAEVVAKRQAE